MPESEVVTINGWTIFAHPFFLDQIDELIEEVEKIKQKHPEKYKKKNSSKRLAAIKKLAFEVIPQDPAKSEYRQGDTLGDEYKHWFRVKFFQQYRLFFRYDSESKIIIFAWVNDESTLRAYGSKKDAYKTFSSMLEKGHPPDDWNKLLCEAQKEIDRLDTLAN